MALHGDHLVGGGATGDEGAGEKKQGKAAVQRSHVGSPEEW